MPNGVQNRSALDAAVKGAVISRPSLLLAVVTTLFVVLFTPGGLFARYDLLPRIGIVATSAVVFSGWAYFFLPTAISFALEKRWPVALVHTLLFVPPSIPFVLLIAGPPFDWSEVGWYSAAALAVVAMTCIVGSLLFQTLVFPKSDVKITPQQLWLFQGPSPERETASHQFLGVKRMEAENQYTRIVTDDGANLLGMTLGQAEEKIVPDIGMRVHRSHWVAFSEIAKIGYVQGNPRLETVSGETIPVSRKKIAELRSAVENYGKS